MNPSHDGRRESQALVDAAWHKSTHSGNANDCVEHAALPSGRQAVRDTKDRARGMLLFSADSWQGFLGG
ncbi:DUF397 domain-containing protein, partial [Streptomyces sp. NPDC049954]|uniref:DUF397 domain-containing protein n=1 Tax=Streptomyces sp. NPDC049954 TaxID=3155779 RepID=UPI003426928F